MALFLVLLDEYGEREEIVCLPLGPGRTEKEFIYNKLACKQAISDRAHKSLPLAEGRTELSRAFFSVGRSDNLLRSTPHRSGGQAVPPAGRCIVKGRNSRPMHMRSGRIRFVFIAVAFIALGGGWSERSLCRTAQAQDRLAGTPIAGASNPASPSLAKRPSWEGSRIVGTPDPPSPYSVEIAFPHLKFEFPLVMVPAPGTRRLFVGDLKGKIW